MEFRTVVPLPSKGAPVITPHTHALVLGSCFAEHVGSRLAEALGEEQCSVNPFGVLYNPVSIAQALSLLLDDDQQEGLSESTFHKRIEDSIFSGRDGLWHSWLFSTHYSAETRDECLQRCLFSSRKAQRILAEAQLLIVTFGTSRYYALADDTAVANCHKEHPATFTEHDCTIEEMVSIWQPLLTKLQLHNPQLQVVFTVSPYRYKKYGYHESQLAKARLLLAVEQLVCKGTASPQSGALRATFPAYEILLDELRDYRFYKPDMLHPSDQAIDYIWQRFREWSFTQEMENTYQQRIKQLKNTRHHVNH